ncbi:MAG: hypothetical protein HYS34_06690, partial [Acidobacteria bacterium]|nr:hypothetical protein [Acidobacteriota bacterium]
EMAAAHAAAVDTFDRSLVEIRQKERDIAELEADGPKSQAALGPAGEWIQTYSQPDGDKDH